MRETCVGRVCFAPFVLTPTVRGTLDVERTVVADADAHSHVLGRRGSTVHATAHIVAGPTGTGRVVVVVVATGIGRAVVVVGRAVVVVVVVVARQTASRVPLPPPSSSAVVASAEVPWVLPAVPSPVAVSGDPAVARGASPTSLGVSQPRLSSGAARQQVDT